MKPKAEQVILVFSQTAALGGSSRSLSIVLNHLKAGNARLIVYMPPGPAAANLRGQGVDIREWSPPACTWIGVPLYSTYIAETSWDRLAYYAADLILLPFRLWKAAQVLADVLEAERPRCVYINSLTLFPLARYLSKLRSKYDFQVIWHIRERLNRQLGSILYKHIARMIARVSDRILAISSNEAEAFESIHPTEILHNSVDVAWSNPSVNEVISKSPARIVMAAAYRPSKGVNDFLEMARIVKKEFPLAEFWLYSPHPIPPRFKRTFRFARRLIGFFSEKLSLALELAENVTGGVLDRNINFSFDCSVTLDMYRAMRVYVRCDRSGSPWGRDVIEAMWAGVSVVATGTSEEFIQHGVTGFLVPPGHPDLLALKVMQLLGDEELCRSFSRAGYERARLLFDPVEHRRRLLRIFGLELSSEGQNA